MPPHRSTPSWAPPLWPLLVHHYKSPLSLPFLVRVVVDHGSPCRCHHWSINFFSLPTSLPSVIIQIDHPRDMPFSQPTSLPVPSAFARLQRSIKSRMHAPSVFDYFVPNHLTVNRRSSLSSTRTQKSFTSKATKRRSLLPLLKLSSSSLSSWSSRDADSPKPVDSDSSADSTIPDIIVTPASPCASALPSPPPLGKKITDRFWPEEDPVRDDQDEVSGNSRFSSAVIVNVLSPPPYHRPAPNVIIHQDRILSSDNYPSHYKNQHDTRPIRFPF